MDYSDKDKVKITDRLEKEKIIKKEDCLTQESCCIHTISENKLICLSCGMQIQK